MRKLIISFIILFACLSGVSTAVFATESEQKPLITEIEGIQPPPAIIPPQPMPYAVCLHFCKLDGIPFMDCHGTCKELVPQLPKM